MGEVPDYYPIITGARYLKVAPWDLAGVPETAGAYAWIAWAVVCSAAENSARQQLAEHQRRRRTLIR